MESLRIGAVMRRSLGISGSLLLPLLAIAIVGHSPHIIAALAPSAEATLKLQSAIEFQLLDAVLAQLISAAVAYLAYLELRGTRVSLFQIPHVIGSRMYPIVIVGLVSQMSVLLMNLQALFGFVALFVITVLFVSVPVVVIEQPGITESLRRSARLTYGRRWNILGLLGVFVLITLVVDLLLHAVFGEQTEVLDPSYVTALSVFRACLAVFGSVVAAVTYDELRRMSGSRSASGL
jgi:hypothetical protein